MKKICSVLLVLCLLLSLCACSGEPQSPDDDVTTKTPETRPSYDVIYDPVSGSMILVDQNGETYPVVDDTDTDTDDDTPSLDDPSWYDSWYDPTIETIEPPELSHPDPIFPETTKPAETTKPIPEKPNIPNPTTIEDYITLSAWYAQTETYRLTTTTQSIQGTTVEVTHVQGRNAAYFDSPEATEPYGILYNNMMYIPEFKCKYPFNMDELYDSFASGNLFSGETTYASETFTKDANGNVVYKGESPSGLAASLGLQSTTAVYDPQGRPLEFISVYDGSIITSVKSTYEYSDRFAVKLPADAASYELTDIMG